MDQLPQEPLDRPKEARTLLGRLRGAIFPIKPSDSTALKGLKQSAFYLFLIMASLVTLTIVVAITFVL